MKNKQSVILATLIISFFASVFCLLSFKSSPPVIDDHRIGDVIYSLLNPAQFKEQHGEGWRLMDGQPFSNDDALVKLYHPAVSPDARGVFIRGMNQGREIKKGDQDGDRAVGTYQADAFMHHSHVVGYPYGAYQFHGLYTNGNGTYQADPNHNQSNTSDVGGNETRPRNIALYVYIKVN